MDRNRQPPLRSFKFRRTVIATRHCQAQTPLWTAFTQAMRENAASTDVLFTGRTRAVASMSGAERYARFAQITRAYTDNTRARATVLGSLYTGLTETQRQIVDKLFAERASAACEPRMLRQSARGH